MNLENIIEFSKEYNFFELTKEIGKNNYQKSQDLISYMSKNSKKYPIPVIIGILDLIAKIFISKDKQTLAIFFAILL